MEKETYDLHKRIMKQDVKAIDEIRSLEEAQDIIRMIVLNIHETSHTKNKPQ